MEEQKTEAEAISSLIVKLECDELERKIEEKFRCMLIEQAANWKESDRRDETA